MTVISGSKGGGSNTTTPTESPDSLHWVRGNGKVGWMAQTFSSMAHPLLQQTVQKISPA